MHTLQQRKLQAKNEFICGILPDTFKEATTLILHSSRGQKKVKVLPNSTFYREQHNLDTKSYQGQTGRKITKATLSHEYKCEVL